MQNTVWNMCRRESGLKDPSRISACRNPSRGFLNCANQGAITFANKTTHPAKNKTPQCSTPSGRDNVERGTIELRYCPTNDMITLQETGMRVWWIWRDCAMPAVFSIWLIRAKMRRIVQIDWYGELSNRFEWFEANWSSILRLSRSSPKSLRGFCQDPL